MIKISTIAHLKYKLENSHSTPHTQLVPGYRNIQLLRSTKSVRDNSLLNEDVHFLKSIKDPKSFVMSQNIKILHAHHGNLGVLLLPFAQEASVPLVCSFRGKDTVVPSKAYKKDLLKLFEGGANFFPVCQYLADIIVDLGCPPEKVRVLYGGIDLEKFQYIAPQESKEHINILSVGRLVEKKGHHILLQAYAKVRGKYPNTSLTLIGGGKYKEYLEMLAQQLELGNSFTLYNHTQYDQIADHMKKADLFVAASLTGKDGDLEGIPNTLKEAMAAGRPVISTYHAGIPELVTNEHNGILVQENNVDELAQALEYMLEKRENWKKYSENARNTIETKFNLQTQLLTQSKFYNQILKS
ncbi:colanic acid biosynthesis glycosyltransferase WcaL [Peribacillus butanolivorans]|uniref:Colanic acid biosynthesis glycosyltransferase WcaL n=2 Tax=Peribacillus butanolivorans TaxID=421767 RepID=A0AAX0RVK8_9BACI|nr:colanic acid biosynthesis glycosyltransferase WcaL [Peribacillus butanolivorans]